MGKGGREGSERLEIRDERSIESSQLWVIVSNVLDGTSRRIGGGGGGGGCMIIF